MGKVQKNRKKSWRKHVDIKDVEEALDDKRLAERTGRDPNAPKFVIETKATPVKQAEDSTASTTNVAESKSGPKQTKDILSGLYIHKSFENRSKVAPATTSRVAPRVQGRRFEKKLLKKTKNMQSHPQKAVTVVGGDRKLYDIWEAEDKKRDDMTDLQDVQLTLIGKNPKKYPVNLLQKPSLLAPVEVPAPGASYNPSLDDHQELLRKAGMVELKKKKEEDHLNRVVRSFYTKTAPGDAERNWFTEMSQGLDGEDEEDQEQTPTDDAEPAGVKNLPVNRDNRKSKAQKRREKSLKIAVDAKKKVKEAKRKEHQLLNIKGSLREIREAEKKSEERQQKRRDVEVSKMYGARRMSRHKYQDPDIEINLPSEIKGSLRAIKTEGNLLEDRFKSLQRRNIIETKVLILKKQKKHRKAYTRSTHREPL